MGRTSRRTENLKGGETMKIVTGIRAGEDQGGELEPIDT